MTRPRDSGSARIGQCCCGTGVNGTAGFRSVSGGCSPGAVPEQIPARARITTRARRQAAQSIGDHCRPPCPFGRPPSWAWIGGSRTTRSSRTPSRCCPLTAASAGPRGRGDPPGKPRDRPGHLGKTSVDRFDTGLVDLSGDVRFFAQINGRTSKALMDWSRRRTPSGRPGSRTSRWIPPRTAPGPLGSRCRTPPSWSTGSSGRVGEPGSDRVPAGTGPGPAWSAGPEGRPGVGAQTGCSAPASPSPKRVPRRCTTRCVSLARQVGLRSAGRERKCCEHYCPLLEPSRTGTGYGIS